MSGITEREKGLLLGAAVVVLASLYFVARVQPLRTELKSLREEVTSLEQRVRNTPMPKPPADPEAAKKELHEAKTHLARAREELGVLMQGRVDQDSNQALEGLMLEILTLAKAKGVNVDTSSVYGGSSADFGVVSKEELATVFSLSDLHVYLTVPFVLSWSLLNAMACECVVLASNTAPVREVIQHEETGLLADFYDIDTLAAQALRVLKDPMHYRPLAARARAFVQQRFSLEATFPKIWKLYEGVLAIG